MMKSKEVIADLKHIQQLLHLLQGSGKIVDATIYDEPLQHAIKCVELQIPKMPIFQSWSPALCPSCKAELSKHLDDGYYEHTTNLEICNCGQKLNWEEEVKMVECECCNYSFEFEEETYNCYACGKTFCNNCIHADVNGAICDNCDCEEDEDYVG